jgi:hypothetical protein
LLNSAILAMEASAYHHPNLRARLDDYGEFMRQRILAAFAYDPVPESRAGNANSYAAGPTDPFGTAPVTPRCTIVQQKPYCNPCFLRRCPSDHRCMKQVTPEMVEAATNPWLAVLPT